MSAVGDGAGGETNAGLVTQMIDGWNPDVFLYLGDVYDKGTYPEFDNWYGQSNFHYGLFRYVTNPAIGNHEYETPGARLLPVLEPRAQLLQLRAGGWHFIALNSNGGINQTRRTQRRTSGCSTTGRQYGALHARVLAPSSQHRPPGRHPRSTPSGALAHAGIDLVLTGHDHRYERWKPLDANLNLSPTGATHIVAGAGGHGVQAAVRSDDRLAVMYGNPANSYGAAYFKLNPKGAEYRYYNTAGQSLDQGVVPCSGTTDTAVPYTPNGLAATTSPSGHVALNWSASGTKPASPPTASTVTASSSPPSAAPRPATSI